MHQCCHRARWLHNLRGSAFSCPRIYSDTISTQRNNRAEQGSDVVERWKQSRAYISAGPPDVLMLCALLLIRLAIRCEMFILTDRRQEHPSPPQHHSPPTPHKHTPYTTSSHSTPKPRQFSPQPGPHSTTPPSPCQAPQTAPYVLPQSRRPSQAHLAA